MRKFFDRGDVVFLDFDPSLGHEQKGRRPALILTKKIFNEQLRVACCFLVCLLRPSKMGIFKDRPKLNDSYHLLDI